MSSADQFKLGDNWRSGADLLAIHSETYNDGRGFVAPIPHLSHDFGPLKLNAIYIPAVPEIVQFSVFSFYITIPMGTWRVPPACSGPACRACVCVSAQNGESPIVTMAHRAKEFKH